MDYAEQSQRILDKQEEEAEIYAENLQREIDELWACDGSVLEAIGELASYPDLESLPDLLRNNPAEAANVLIKAITGYFRMQAIDSGVSTEKYNPDDWMTHKVTLELKGRDYE